MDFYLNLLNDKERGDGDQPVYRHHPLRGKGRRGSRICPAHESNPIGVAVYQLQSKLPANLKGKLPTAKQLADVVRAVLPEKSAS